MPTYHPPAATLITAAVAALLYTWLSINVVRLRWKHKAAFGHQADELMRACRVHGNFAEYVPFILVLMLLLEMTGAPTVAMALSGVVLIASRLAHWAGVVERRVPNSPRAIGVVGTFGLMFILATWILLRSILWTVTA